jgi:hypothetical protein
MDFNLRKTSILTGKKNLESIFSLKDFPVSMTCISQNNEYSNDKYLDMEFQICKDTGIIQLKKYPFFDDMYINPHNESVGETWNILFDIMVEKISKITNKLSNPKILEIGGGALLLASKILNNNNNIETYDVYEKNSSKKYTNDKRLKLIEEYFSSETKLPYNPDIVIHSHVLEHVWQPVEFIHAIKNSKCKYHCFIVPNLQVTFKKKYTNSQNFEHNFFIAEPYIDVILHNNNFEIVEKEYYLDHSIIYITKYNEKTIIPNLFPNLYNQNKQLVIDFKNYHETIITNFNDKIKNFDGEVYLFGGHIFSQFLIKFGLKTDKIKCILDNSKEKNKYRLYGTKLTIEFPEIIKNIDKCAVILKVASYQNEIKKQLYELNKDVIIYE